MRWLIVAAVLAVEGTFVVLLLHAMARWLSVWIRWPAWMALLCVTSMAAFAVRASPLLASSPFRHDRGGIVLNLDAPFPTVRLLFLASVAGLPILLLVLGIASLLRRKDSGLQLARWSASWRSSFMALGCAIGALLAVLMVNDARIRHRIREMDNEAQALSIESAPPPCPDDENAAVLYQQIDIGSTKGLPEFDDNVDLLQSAPWTEYLARHRTQADRVRYAAALPCCRFDIDWSRPNVLADYPEYRQVQACIRLLYQEGRHALLNGNVDDGFANAVALRRIAEQLSKDPRSILQLLAYAADGSSASLIEHFIYLRRPTSEEVAQLVRPGFEFRNRLTATCTREQAERYHMLGQAYLGMEADPTDNQSFAVPAMHSVILVQERLLFAGDDTRALPLVFAELKRRSSLPYDRLLSETNESLSLYAYKSGGGRLTKSMSIFAIVAANARADMQRRLADFALMIAERELDEEILKKSPEEIIPAATRPIDLFDGNPIRLIVADGGVIAYSIDIHGEDDGGTEGIPASESGGRGYLEDMTFCFGEAFKVRRLTLKKDEQR